VFTLLRTVWACVTVLACSRSTVLQQISTEFQVTQVPKPTTSDRPRHRPGGAAVVQRFRDESPPGLFGTQEGRCEQPAVMRVRPPSAPS
jgi:hypothetical protein